ncbi:hypothetical protein [Taibaiella koreensis]|uniref:hypothetical protein n=1 Tax=Taibaiella koreensis TaxID=1268548 RepID=UPI000E59B9F0|nr:hypothetical protein [Taibaiella koreensis]
MNLREAILEEHSRQQVSRIVQWIGANTGRIAALIDIFCHDEYRVVQRAAWIVSDVARQHPELMLPHIPALVQRLEDDNTHIAVKRNVYRVMQYLELPEAVHAPLMNSCFDSLANPREALAVRAFAMSILARLALVYPEIGHELKLLIEDNLLQEPAPSFKSRARKVLQQLEKHIR